VTTTVDAPAEPTPPAPRGGASARLKRRYVVAASICALAIVAVVVLAVALSENVVYFRTVSEAVKSKHDQGTSRFRLAGAVVPGSDRDRPWGVTFEVTDGDSTVRVDHRGDKPELFKGGAPVVCEGRWAKGSGLVFDSDRIMIKHGSDYSPPKVDTHDAPKAPTRATSG
jgi:cytochrome c-type biogenesis protein CcmE